MSAFVQNYSPSQARLLFVTTLGMDNFDTNRKLRILGKAQTKYISTGYPHLARLNITGIEPDLWYIVEITNDSSNPTGIPCGGCPLYYPHYNFTVDNGKMHVTCLSSKLFQ